MPHPDSPPVETDAMGLNAMKIARILGITIRVHVSVLIIFALIVSSLGGGLFPIWHPEWPTVVTWSAALSAGILFFISLLVHEMSHSVTARHRGIEISGITLFLFGGMAQMRGEPQTPKDEFLIAGAGPLASLVLGVLFGLAAGILIPAGASLVDSAGELDFSQIDAPATICLWLSTVNFMLAAFNLLPGFPMDGGRLFRAALWWRSGDFMSATRTAAQVGGGVGWAFIILGLAQLISGQALNGFWMMLIGWFIRRLAQTSVASLMLEHALKGLDVAAMMRTHFEKIPPHLSLADFRDEFLLRSNQQIWPVTTPESDVGYVSLEALQLSDANPDLNVDTVGNHLLPLDHTQTIRPQTSAKEALEQLTQRTWPVPVVEGNRVIGIIHHADILRWFAVHKPGNPT